MRSLLTLSAVFATLTLTHCQGQSPTAPPFGYNLSPAWKTTCEQALKTPLPAEADVPPLPDGTRKTSSSFYYGVRGESQDFEVARHLAWQERAAVPTHPGGYGIFTGTLVLAMIYANGQGTPRNTALALRMGCEATSYPNNLTSADLNALQASVRGESNSQAPFDICGTGSPKEIHEFLCGNIAYLKNRKRILNEIATLTADWDPAQKSALAALESAEEKFGASSVIWEGQDLTPGRVGERSPDWFSNGKYDEAHAEFDNAFLASMRNLPVEPSGLAAVPQADAELNRNYRTLMDKLRVPDQGDILSPLQERGIEREWITYRDAWVTLVTARFGAEKAALWRARMTAERGQKLARISDRYESPDPEALPWLSMCEHARAAPLPSDITAEPSEPQFPVCASFKPYYGIDAPVDFRAARQCAIAERNLIHFQSSQNIGFEGVGAQIGEEINGSVMLTMLYANGQGVPRNILLAQRFACEAIDDQQVASNDGFASDEKRAAVPPALLEAIASPVPSHLDMCNYVAPLARALDMCDFIAMTGANEKRTAALNAIARSMTPVQKTAYDRLLTALHAYLSAHDHNEVAVMGHYLFSGGWQGISTEREQAFLEDMRKFERKELPRSTSAEFAADDKALNAAYQKVLASAPEKERTTAGEHMTGNVPTKASIRATEKLWIVYRDAFADFGTLRYPSTTREAWKAYVTKQRTRDLGDPCFPDAECQR
ncbi:MAG: hypothetical protein P4K93_02335 [Terracidiphilus sp.]|nr:hypothetical protein [Terracidiphilus sp.]MDR3796960.1 hypothetical protein [Terracidiphilus sp.]